MNNYFVCKLGNIFVMLHSALWWCCGVATQQSTKWCQTFDLTIFCHPHKFTFYIFRQYLLLAFIRYRHHIPTWQLDIINAENCCLATWQVFWAQLVTLFLGGVVIVVGCHPQSVERDECWQSWYWKLKILIEARIISSL